MRTKYGKVAHLRFGKSYWGWITTWCNRARMADQWEDDLVHLRRCKDCIRQLALSGLTWEEKERQSGPHQPEPQANEHGPA